MRFVRQIGVTVAWARMTMCRSLVVIWLLPSLMVCAVVPEIAPAVSLPGLFDAPEVAGRVSDTYMLDAYIWRDSQPLIITGDKPLTSSQTRLPDRASPLMATLYLNDMACNRETEPLIHCETAYLLTSHSNQAKQWHSVFADGDATVRGGPGWQIGSLVEVVLQARDAEGVFFVSTNTTIEATQ